MHHVGIPLAGLRFTGKRNREDYPASLMSSHAAPTKSLSTRRNFGGATRSDESTVRPRTLGDDASRS